MLKLNKIWTLASRSILFVLLITNLWIFSLTTPSASANLADNTHVPTALTEENSDIAKNRKARIDIIGDCRKYLNNDTKDIANLDKPLDRMGNKNLADTLKVTDKAAPTEGEVQFKRCLEEKGIAPKV
ncbi:MAG TPA: hypothetical protein V6D28_29980 [Leptolyngbyaceae cyanobacterium]